MIEEPVIVHFAGRPTAVIPLTVPREQIRSVMGPAIGELLRTLAEQGMAPAGAVFSHHLRMDPEVFDFEVGVPVVGGFAEAGRVRASQLAACKVARTVYMGSYEGLAEAWGEFEDWIAAEGHECRSNLWESYVAGPESGLDASHWRTVLHRPLQR